MHVGREPVYGRALFCSLLTDKILQLVGDLQYLPEGFSHPNWRRSLFIHGYQDRCLCEGVEKRIHLMRSTIVQSMESLFESTHFVKGAL